MRFFVYYAMLFFPLVLFPLEERCITVFILRYRTVQHYGKERIKPYWEDVTSDSLSSIQCVFDKKSTRLKVSYDSVTMCATIKSDIFRLSDSVEIYLRPSVKDSLNVAIMMNYSNSIITDITIQDGFVPYHQMIMYTKDKEKYKKANKYYRKRRKCI